MATKTKTKQKASASAPKTKQTIEVNTTLTKLINSRIGEIGDAMSGNVRIRADRWHGKTSLYDTQRVMSFLTNIGKTLNMDKFYALAREIPTFFQVLGPNLSRAISASL